MSAAREPLLLPAATARLAIKGMTCNSCVQTIEAQLRSLPGVVAAKVYLAEEAADVQYDAGLLDTHDLVDTVEGCGFDCRVAGAAAVPSKGSVVVTVKGMTCQSCVKTVTAALKAHPGVQNAVVDLASETASVDFDPQTVTPAQIMAAIEDCGFEASLPGSQQSATEPAITHFDISVKGMTCQSCVKTVTGKVAPMIGVQSVKVNLIDENASVELDTSLVSPQTIVTAIEECGFDAALREPSSSSRALTVQHFDISVKGMTCQSCVKTVTAKLTPMIGVKSVVVDLAAENASVELDTSLVGPRTIVSAIEECGFDAALLSDSSHALNYGEKRGREIAQPLSISITKQNKQHRNSFSVSPSRRSATSPRYTATTAGPVRTVQLEIRGMTCASCVATIEKHLRTHPAIVSCKVALLAERAEVQFKELMMDGTAVANLVNDVGFVARVLPDDSVGTLDLKIFGMTCGSCSGKIEREVAKMGGVVKAAVNLLGQSGRFQYDSAVIGVRDIVEKIEELGFQAFLSDMGSNAQAESLERTREIQEWRTAFWNSFKYALPVMLTSMIFPLTPLAPVLRWQLVKGLYLSDLIMLVLTIPVQFGIGGRFYTAAYKALSHGSYTMDVLITLGTTIAFVFSVLSIVFSVCSSRHLPPQVFFETSTTLITFITLGRYLENLAKGKTSSALSKLMSLAPTNALLLSLHTETGEISEKNIPSEYVQAGDLLKIVPGERVPADGVVEFGSTQIDESLVTGEPLPVGKRIGDSVIGGTVNGSGVIHMRAVRVGADTTLSQIVKLVNDAQTSKAPIQDIADTVAGYFVPGVILLGAATFLAWLAILNVTTWRPSSFPEGSSVFFICLSMSISVIVVACPCALGLATPTAVMVGTGVGAQLGILIKGGAPLETAHRVTKFVFDKTGTLTLGKLSVVGCKLAEGMTMTEREFLGIVGAGEASSEHPLGKAIAKHGKQVLGLATGAPFPHRVDTFEAVAGSGVQCAVYPTQDGAKPVQVLIGNAKFLAANGCGALTPAFIAITKQHESAGHTVVFVAFDGRAAGLIAMADTLKPSAAPTIRALHAMGVQVAMVTGDQLLTAHAIAQSCGIPPTHVHAGVTPSGKKSLVQKFQSGGHVVAMVGDGINDSASISQADMGIAVFGGTDVAVEAATVVLMRDELADVVTAIDLSRVIFRRIRNICMIPLAMGLLSPWGITLPAMVAGMAMSLSSVSVVLSSLHLKFYQPPASLQDPRLSASASVIADIDNENENDDEQAFLAADSAGRVDLEMGVPTRGRRGRTGSTSGGAAAGQEFVRGVRELLNTATAKRAPSPKKGYARLGDNDVELDSPLELA
ncbi:ATPase Cu transporting protein 7B [Geranomyces variabilis]|uniref:P-type Cu(+) transporter n=1 Tax=Geranomyces variabilis TaxID=109894 RepID=A0AAD5TGS2_9FUNG|nr:ATPase Cu transporting protein 7B [Geranomyces variabilis]